MDHGYGSCSIRYESRHASGKWIVWPGALIHTLHRLYPEMYPYMWASSIWWGYSVYIYIYIHTQCLSQLKYKTYKTQQNGMFLSDVVATQWVYKMGIYPAANFHNTFYGNPSGFPFELFHSYIKLLEAANHKKWDNYLQYEIWLLVYPQYEKTINYVYLFMAYKSIKCPWNILNVPDWFVPHKSHSPLTTP